MKHRRWRKIWIAFDDMTGKTLGRFRRWEQAADHCDKLLGKTNSKGALLVPKFCSKLRSWQKKPRVFSEDEFYPLNVERMDLIDQKYLRGLTLAEHHRLHYLNSVADRFLEKYDLETALAVRTSLAAAA